MTVHSTWVEDIENNPMTYDKETHSTWVDTLMRDNTKPKDLSRIEFIETLLGLVHNKIETSVPFRAEYAKRLAYNTTVERYDSIIGCIENNIKLHAGSGKSSFIYTTAEDSQVNIDLVVLYFRTAGYKVEHTVSKPELDNITPTHTIILDWS